jgi:hypothetical protein
MELDLYCFIDDVFHASRSHGQNPVTMHFTLKMETARYSEMLVFHLNTSQHHNPKDLSLGLNCVQSDDILFTVCCYRLVNLAKFEHKSMVKFLIKEVKVLGRFMIVHSKFTGNLCLFTNKTASSSNGERHQIKINNPRSGHSAEASDQKIYEKLEAMIIEHHCIRS